MKRVLFVLGVFGFGFMAGVNVADLVPNPDYEADWSNVMIAGVFGLLFKLKASFEDLE